MSSTASTLMTLCFKFVAPCTVSGMFRRSGRLRTYTKDELLESMLSDFRDVVLAEMGEGISTFKIVNKYEQHREPMCFYFV